MIDYDTILSTTEDKLTLMQWLKKVEAALKDASATTFKVNKKGAATLTLSIVFADGSELESGEIVLQQGESVASGAIVNGHLELTLTNGDVLDCGELLNGNLNVNGDLSVTGTATLPTITSNAATISALKPIIQPITNIIFSRAPISENVNVSYASAARNGNKLTLVISGTIEKSTAFSSTIGRFLLPVSILDKLIPVSGSYVCAEQVYLWDDAFTLGVSKPQLVQKGSTAIDIFISQTSTLTDNKTYNFRSEFTFLLSDSLQGGL